MALISTLDNVTIGVQNSGASSTSLIGLKIGNINTSNYGQKDIIIRRCHISSIDASGTTGGICTNWIIENNILNDIQLPNDKTNVYNFLIKNNIVQGYLYYTHACVINNNIFIGNQSDSFQDVSYLII